MGNCNLRDNQPIDISYAHFGSSNFDLVIQSMGSRLRESIGLSRALENFSDILPTSFKLYAFVDQESLGRLLLKQDLGTSGYHTRVRKAYSIILDFSSLTILHLPGKNQLMGLVDGISRLQPGHVSEIPKAFLAPKIDFSSNKLKLIIWL